MSQPENVGGSVAIVGIGAIFPDAPDPARFWDNIRHCRSAGREVPAGRWCLSPDAVFDPTVGAADRVYSRRGCSIDQLPPVTELAGLAIKPDLPQRPASVFGATVSCGFVVTTIGYGGAAWVVARAVALGAR